MVGSREVFLEVLGVLNRCEKNFYLDVPHLQSFFYCTQDWALGHCRDDKKHAGQSPHTMSSDSDEVAFLRLFEVLESFPRV